VFEHESSSSSRVPLLD